MQDTQREVTSLLEALKRANEDDPNYAQGLFQQELISPRPAAQGVPTLEPGVYRRPTPQLAARFDFCGTWVDAHAGETWLGIVAMERAWYDECVQEQLAIRREHWEGSVLSEYDRRSLSVFSIDTEEHNETYLLWPEEEGNEPQLCRYFGHDATKFDDLLGFLKWLRS